MHKIYFAPFVFLLSLSLFFGCRPTRTSDALSKSENLLPACLSDRIKNEDLAHNLPQKITKYTYQGKTVYYVTAPCCDQFNVVYDSVCNVLGAPDGGITGRGNGKLSDFFDEATDGETVWTPEKSPRK